MSIAFGNVIAGKFGGKYSPQAVLAVKAQDPAVDGFIAVISRRDPENPYEIHIEGLEDLEQIVYMKELIDSVVRKAVDMATGNPEPPPVVA